VLTYLNCAFSIDARYIGNFGDRAFNATGQRVWNSLPTDRPQDSRTCHIKPVETVAGYIFNWPVDKVAVWTYLLIVL